MTIVNNLRKVDSLGRVVIPKNIREEFGICYKDEMAIHTNEDSIIINKKFNTCSICGDKHELTEFKGKDICLDCIAYIKSYK
ncbi:MAG: AbrB/MazE/SpoVT family DNA-binding domain-containing protein [Firmicutes bacterium]|nr:AbrB/MazE/SpoVT family DNA-binding domain-containing protein [Bacillota bacterium]